jgi:deaminated glutathione amidase
MITYSSCRASIIIASVALRFSVRGFSLSSSTSTAIEEKTIASLSAVKVAGSPFTTSSLKSYSTNTVMDQGLAKAAVAQLTSTSDKLLNLRDIAICAALAKQNGATMLFLPECFGYIGSSPTETLQNAEIIERDYLNEADTLETTEARRSNNPLITNWIKSILETAEGESFPPYEKDLFKHTTEGNKNSISIMDGLRTIAISSGLWISGGGIHEYVDGERVYNTHVIMNNQGEVVSSYRKVHLFDVSIPDRGIDLQESKTTKPGDSWVVCDSPLGMLGLSTCYDMRFPEQYTHLAQNMGAQILLMPSAFTVPTGQAHWHVLLRARAIETQCYVIAAAQVGQHNPKRQSYGHAIVINPWGDIVADAGPEDSPTVVFCDIDLTLLHNVRQRMPIQSHRDAASQALMKA